MTQPSATQSGAGSVETEDRRPHLMAQNPGFAGRAAPDVTTIAFPTLAVLLWPRRAFFTLAQKPRVLFRLLLTIGMATLPALVFVSHVDRTRLAEQVLRQGQTLSELPAEERAATLAKTAKALTVMLPGAAAGRRLAFIFLVAALAFALLRGPIPQLRFSLLLTTVALSTAPLLLADAIKLIQALGEHALFVDLNNPVRGNLAAWLDLDVRTSVLGAFAKSIDIFLLWTVSLCATGLSLVTAKRGWLPKAAPWALLAGSITLDVMGAALRSTG